MGVVGSAATDRSVVATVVVIAWNGADLIGPCLDAVASQQLADGFVTWVIENASTDSTAAVVDRERVGLCELARLQPVLEPA